MRREAREVQRHGWKNKFRPRIERGGIYEIYCPHCEKRFVFLTDKNRVNLNGFPNMQKILLSKYFLAKKLDRKTIMHSFH